MITFYREQVCRIQEAVDRSAVGQGVVVNTVDGFQVTPFPQAGISIALFMSGGRERPHHPVYSPSKPPHQKFSWIYRITQSSQCRTDTCEKMVVDCRPRQNSDEGNTMAITYFMCPCQLYHRCHIDAETEGDHPTTVLPSSSC